MTVVPAAWMATGLFQEIDTVPLFITKVPERLAVTVVDPPGAGTVCEIVTVKLVLPLVVQVVGHETLKLPKPPVVTGFALTVVEPWAW